MNKILVFSICLFFGLRDVNADIYDGIYSSFSSPDVVINSGGTLDSNGNTIVLERHTTIDNSGTVFANIDMNEYNMHLRNNGVFTGNINIGTGQLFQIIKNNNDITNLNISGISENNYRLNITDADENINLGSLKDLNAPFAEINNSKIVIDDFNDWRSWQAEVYLIDAELIIKNPETVVSGETIIPTLRTNGLLKTSVQNTGSLYNVSAFDTDGFWRIYLSREFNYEKVFSDNRGVLLKDLRAANPNDKLLKIMDTARNMAELNDVMNRSYRFNRAILAKPLKVINRFSMLNTINSADDDFGGNVYYIMSNSLNGVGGTLNIGNNFDNVFLGLGIDLNDFSFEDDVNNFKGVSYGINAKLSFDIIQNIRIKNKIGFNWISFDTEDLIVDNEIKNNPNGYSLYNAFDIEYKNLVYGDLSVVPFVGMTLQKDKILDYDETDFGLRGGGNIKYDFVIDGMQYEYSGGGALGTNGDIYASFKIGFMSISDEAGANIGCDIIKDDDNLNYKLSLSGKIKF